MVNLSQLHLNFAFFFYKLEQNDSKFSSHRSFFFPFVLQHRLNLILADSNVHVLLKFSHLVNITLPKKQPVQPCISFLITYFVAVESSGSQRKIVQKFILFCGSMKRMLYVSYESTINILFLPSLRKHTIKLLTNEQCYDQKVNNCQNYISLDCIQEIIC